MDQNKKYVLVKMITGETLIGSVGETKSTTITIDNPLVYQVVSVTNSLGMKVKELLVFRLWCEFALESSFIFHKKNILSILTPDPKFIEIYLKEIAGLQFRKEKNTKKEEEESPADIQDDITKAISGNLHFNFAFDNPDHFQMFMDNIQMSIDGFMNEMNGDDAELTEEDLEEILEQMPPQNRKKAKNRIKPKESFDLPYEQDADPRDPRSWSNNPEDYLK